MQLLEAIIDWISEVSVIVLWFCAVLFAGALNFFDAHAAGLTFLCGLPVVIIKTINLVREYKNGGRRK
jgi:hypothetical protein